MIVTIVTYFIVLLHCIFVSAIIFQLMLFIVCIPKMHKTNASCPLVLLLTEFVIINFVEITVVESFLWSDTP